MFSFCCYALYVDSRVQNLLRYATNHAEQRRPKQNRAESLKYRPQL
jgi:hypothetical protein